MIHVYLIIISNFCQIVFQNQQQKSLSMVPSESCKIIKYDKPFIVVNYRICWILRRHYLKTYLYKINSFCVLSDCLI